MIALTDGPARRFLAGLGDDQARPSAILVVSAHWATARPTLSLADPPTTIHDFGPFDSRLNGLRYPAPGAPDLARRAQTLLADAGFAPEVAVARGLDHGAWIPLTLMYPAADLPVTQLSVQPHLGPAHHHAVGRALAPLREQGVMILASGSLTHNLREIDFADVEAASPPWVDAFADWIADRLAATDLPALLDYRARAPEAARNHPTDEHLLPLFVAAGAGGAAPPIRLHASRTHGTLAMDAYAFH